jgi:DNA polymerase-2
MASIMIEYNVSPETVVHIEEPGEGYELPELGVKILSRRGLIPQTLQFMRDKRLALKRFLKAIDKNEPRYRASYRRYKAVADALKWLTVVCYGRLGFANSTFGRINAHEVVSYLSRKAITRSKSIAESMGFHVLHVYVDSLFVSRPGASREDYQILANEIGKETHLPMDLENIYSWFAFLSSRQNPNLSVANRFYGLAANGEHKIRGIALRRGDTCRFVANTQRGVLEILARPEYSEKLVDLLPEVLAFVQERFKALKNREISLDELVVAQTLSRELEGYSVLSPVANAARQLQVQGKAVRMGQRIRFIYVGPGPGVHAQGLPVSLDPRTIDLPKYRELTFRAVHEVLQPLGVTEQTLRNWLFSKAGYVTGPGQLHSTDSTRLELPLFNDLKHLRVDVL